VGEPANGERIETPHGGESTAGERIDAPHGDESTAGERIDAPRSDESTAGERIDAPRSGESTAGEWIERYGSPNEAGQPRERGPADASPGDGGTIGGLIVDWGGVMTTNVFGSFSAFCEAEGLDPATLAKVFRGDPAARELLIGFEEGRVEEAVFEAKLGDVLGLASPEGLIDRLFAGTTLEESMVDAVRAARKAGIATGLISNSWGTARYPRELLDELFDGVVISGEVGIRKPAPRIYELGVQAIAREPGECVFVDDLPFNLPPATELGMATVHHTAADTTIAELERLLRIQRLSTSVVRGRRA
jgi:putative hydrolase of the HAD superfamily